MQCLGDQAENSTLDAALEAGYLMRFAQPYCMPVTEDTFDAAKQLLALARFQ
jgi:hypothetical protein